MSIQHRDIPDSERHELKGSSTAIAGSVPVANGSGGTAFQKIGVSSLTGALPTSIPDLILATDGSGGLKPATSVYGAFDSVYRPGQTVNVFFQINSLITPQGVSVVAGGAGSSVHDYIQVSTTGFYLVGVHNGNFIKNTFPNDVVVNTPIFLVYLDSGSQYRMDAEGKFFLWKIM